jgi:hypothetical protein
MVMELQTSSTSKKADLGGLGAFGRAVSQHGIGCHVVMNERYGDPIYEDHHGCNFKLLYSEISQ